MKSFAFGLIVGAGACYAVMRLISPPVAQNAGIEQVVLHPGAPMDSQSSTSPSCPEVSKEVSKEPKAAVRSVDRPPGNSQSDTPVATTVVHRRISIDDVSEEEANQFCGEVFNRERQRERDKKDGEPKDAAWAYAMEQLLRQHMESGLAANQYTKLRIDCRTTFCEMRIEGVGDKNQKLAAQLAQEVAKQSWSDMIDRGHTTTANGNTWSTSHEWFRPTTEAERRLWTTPRQ